MNGLIMRWRAAVDAGEDKTVTDAIFEQIQQEAAAELQAEVAAMESRTPELGARLVARAWTDPKIFDLADPKVFFLLQCNDVSYSI